MAKEDLRLEVLLLCERRKESLCHSLSFSLGLATFVGESCSHDGGDDEG